VDRARRPGRHRVLGAAALSIAVVAGLSSCGGQSGQALAQQACVHVHRSVRDYVRSRLAGTPAATVASLQREADQELRIALPLAAAANSADGSWNSLMTTISEGATVDEGHLVPSLNAQCLTADTQVNVNPQAPGANVNPRSPGANVNPQSPDANVNPRSPGTGP
jgi:hypothetical protein